MKTNRKKNVGQRRQRPEGQKGQTPRVQIDSRGMAYEVVRGALPRWARKSRLSGKISKQPPQQ